MTTVFTTQIELDNRGVAFIAGTKTKVIEVILDKMAHGWSPEETHFQHPHLSLAQIHAALAYYYENQGRLDEQIRQDFAEAGELVAHFSDATLRQRLQDLKRSR